MKCSLGISNFLEEISSLSHSVVFLYFFALIAEEGFLISSCCSLELCIQMLISFLFSLAGTSKWRKRIKNFEERSETTKESQRFWLVFFFFFWYYIDGQTKFFLYIQMFSKLSMLSEWRFHNFGNDTLVSYKLSDKLSFIKLWFSTRFTSYRYIQNSVKQNQNKTNYITV